MNRLSLIPIAGLLVASSHGQFIDPNTPLTKALADGLYDSIGSAPRSTYPVPPNWTGAPINFTLFESTAGHFTADLNPDSLRPADYHTYNVIYVDWQKGSDQNTGLSKLSPLRKLSVALNRPGNKWILCRPGLYDFRSSWAGVTPSGNVLMEPWDETGYVFSSSQMDNLAWQADGAIYSSATSAFAAQLIDESTRDAYGVGARLTRVASVEAVRVTPGSYYATSKRVWARLSNGRMPDGQVMAFARTANGKMGDGNLWARGVVFLGGANTFVAEATNPNSRYTFSDCFFKYASSGDGFNLSGPGNATFFRSGAIGNYGDGLEYKNGARFLEISSAGCGNGTAASFESNGSSASNNCQGVIIGGQYAANYGRNVNYLQNSQVMMFGSQLGGSLATGGNSVDLGCGKEREDTSAVWALGLFYTPGSQYCRAVSTTGTIWIRKHRDSRADLLGGRDRIKPI
jgi:hypothetical protein